MCSSRSATSRTSTTCPTTSPLPRPSSGEEAKAVGLYLQVASYLRQALGSQPVIGPELANPAHWRDALPGVISALHPQTLGVHSYPLSVCRSPREATIHGLLAKSVGNAPRRLSWVVADAARCGRARGDLRGQLGLLRRQGRRLGQQRIGGVGRALRARGPGDGLRRSELPPQRQPLRPVLPARHGSRAHGRSRARWWRCSSGSEPARRCASGQAWARSRSPLSPRAGSEPLLVLDNEAAKPAKLLLRGAAAVSAVQAFTPSGSGGVALAPSGSGRWLLTLPADGVLALRFAL